MSSDEDVLIQALEKRLANLEAIVLGSDPVFAARLSKLSRYAQLYPFYSFSTPLAPERFIEHRKNELI